MLRGQERCSDFLLGIYFEDKPSFAKLSDPKRV